MPIVIRERNKFRPSDWAERLACNFMESFEGNRIRYKHVYPMRVNGQQALFIADELDEASAVFLLSFARKNGLIIDYALLNEYDLAA